MLANVVFRCSVPRPRIYILKCSNGWDVMCDCVLLLSTHTQQMLPFYKVSKQQSDRGRPMQNIDLEEGPNFNVALFAVVCVFLCLRTDFIIQYIKQHSLHITMWWMAMFHTQVIFILHFFFIFFLPYLSLY